VIDTKIDEMLAGNWTIIRLEQFLDDDGFVNELRKENPKLIN